MVAIRRPTLERRDGWGASTVIATPVDGGSATKDETGGLPALLRPSRRDALPEHTRYVDTGCEVHHSCLSCPLVRCRYDEPGGARHLLSEERDRKILALRREGRSVTLIAQRFGISRRTVFRVLAADRQRMGNG